MIEDFMRVIHRFTILLGRVLMWDHKEVNRG